MLGAGMGVLQALDQLSKNPPSRSFRPRLVAVKEDLDQGSTFTEALRRRGDWLPSFDLALLEAGERSGRVDACCHLLAEYYRERAQMMRKVASDLAYPFFLVHAAVFLFPFPALFVSGDILGYLTQALGILLPLYGAVALLVYACQGRHGEWWRSTLEQIFGMIPVLGPARRSLAIARLSAALEALVNAGVSILNAWELAGTASGSPALRREILRWRPRLESGETPAEILRTSSSFPEIFSNLYATAEVTGTVDTTLKRLFHYYQDEATVKMRALAEWTPRLIYIGIMLIIAARILSFYTGYFNQIEKLTE